MAKPANKTKAKPVAKPATKVKNAPKAKSAKPIKTASKPTKAASKVVKSAPKAAKPSTPAPKPSKPAPKVSQPSPAVKSATKTQSVKSKKTAPTPPPATKPAAKTLVKKASEAPVKSDKVVSVRTSRGKAAAPAATPKKAVYKETNLPVIFPEKNPHSKIFIGLQKQRLLQLKDDLVDSMSGMASETLRSRAQDSEASAFGMHQADAGSDAYDRDFTLSLLSQEQDALYEIEEALKRIEKGTYGICEMSAKTIPVDRLEVRPYARFTVECQEIVDKEYGPNSLRRGIRSLFGLGTDEEDEDGDEDSADEKES
jgi:RNA polymerase-binding transcription factor DksA